MTDPSDPDTQLDRAIARLVHDAGADAPQPPDLSAFERTGEPASSDPTGRRRLATAGTLLLIVGAVAGVMYVTARDDGGSTVRPVDSRRPTPVAPSPRRRPWHRLRPVLPHRVSHRPRRRPHRTIRARQASLGR